MSLSTTAPPAVTPTSGAYRDILLYDAAAPATVVASIIEGRSETYEELFFTALVTCPSPCQDSAFPEQTVTYLTGSSWAGELTVDGTTTSWGCRLGDDDSQVTEGVSGECYTAIAGPGETIDHNGTSTHVDNCFVSMRSKMMVVTAGFEEYDKVMPSATFPIDEVVSSRSSRLSELGCPATTATEAAASSAPTGVATKTSNAPGQTQSSDSTTPSGSGEPDSAGSAVYRNMALLLGATALAAIVQL